MHVTQNSRTKSLYASGLVRTGGVLASLGVVAFALVPLLAKPVSPTVETEEVSAPGGAGQPDAESNSPSVSSDGRFIAYRSLGRNLVPGDTNEVGDVFVKDRQTGSVARVSIAADGAQADAESRAPSISGAGQKVVFTSDATNLVSGDANGVADVFLRDVGASTTVRVSTTETGAEADGESLGAVISNDGRYVAFASRASNLVSGDSNGLPDVFVKDLVTGVLERVSVGPSGQDASGGSESPALSEDGRYVAFASTASNLLDIANGSDANSVWDIYVRDRSNGITIRASVSSVGAEGNGNSFAPAVSADGALVVFASYASNLVSGDTNEHVDIMLRHLTGGTTTVLSSLPSYQFDGDSFHPCISGDGYSVAFDTLATNVDQDTVEGKTGVFVCNLTSGTLSRCSVASNGASANASAARPALSYDGRWVAFSSDAWNLVSTNTGSTENVYLRGPLP